MDEEELKNVKLMLRSVLISAKDGVSATVVQRKYICRDYKLTAYFIENYHNFLSNKTWCMEALENIDNRIQFDPLHFQKPLF